MWSTRSRQELLLCGESGNRHIPLKNRGSIYNACIRPVLLYGAETWNITKKLEETLQSCDRRMLPYMAGVSLSDRVASNDVASRCGVKPPTSSSAGEQAEMVWTCEETEMCGRARKIYGDGND